MDKKEVITIGENDRRIQLIMETKDNQIKNIMNECSQVTAELQLTLEKLNMALSENAQLKADAAKASIKKTSPKLAEKIEKAHEDVLKKAGDAAMAALNGKDEAHG